jgi:hypothetical protein
MNKGRAENLNKLATEKIGLSILFREDKSFIEPTKEQKLKLYSMCGIDFKRFSRSTDCIQLLVPDFESIKSMSDFNFIEVKTTNDKKVNELPFGVFFGFTENEECLFRVISNYRLCIVHTTLNKFYCLDYEEYQSMIQTKRVQYQINFKPKPKNPQLGLQ